MNYGESAPPIQLRTLVASLWRFAVPQGEPAHPQAIPLTGGVILGKQLGGGPVLCFGPRVEPLQSPVAGGDRFAGLHLWPGVHRAWLGRDLPPLRGVVRPLASWMDAGWVDRLGAVLEEAAERDWGPTTSERLGRVLLELPPGAPADRAILTAVLGILRMEGREPVGGLAAEAGLAPATFRRRFRLAVELSPKELARIRRVRAAAVDGLAGGRWAGIAAERGFADQAHLIREFQELLGHPPETFRAQGRGIAHRLFDP